MHLSIHCKGVLWCPECCVLPILIFLLDQSNSTARRALALNRIDMGLIPVTTEYPKPFLPKGTAKIKLWTLPQVCTKNKKIKQTNDFCIWIAKLHHHHQHHQIPQETNRTFSHIYTAVTHTQLHCSLILLA